MSYVYFADKESGELYTSYSEMAADCGMSVYQAQEMVNSLYRGGGKIDKRDLTSEQVEDMRLPGAVRHLGSGRLYANASIAGEAEGVTRQWIYQSSDYDFPYGKCERGHE